MSATRRPSLASGTWAATPPKANANRRTRASTRTYGIPRTSNEAQTGLAQGSTAPNSSFIWEGKAGSPSVNVKPFDMQTRRTVDRESAERSVAFMERNARARRSFFLYYPMTQIHFPTLTHPDFDGKTGTGDIGDAMADVDHNVGLVLDAIDRLGIAKNTIVFWCTDNGAEARRPWRGSPGPWSGFYNTVMEGGVRTPCIVRWPGRIPAGRASNAIVHQVDIFPTLAAAIGRDIVPKDRAIDGVNQLPVFLGKQVDVEPRQRHHARGFADRSRRRAVKWHDWKLHYVSPARARRRRRYADDATLSPAVGSPGGVGREGRQPMGEERHGQDRRGLPGLNCALSARAAERARPQRAAD